MSVGRPNPTLDLLRGGMAVRAFWFCTGSPALAEVAAESGPDAVVFDCQHGLWDRSALAAAIPLVTPATPLVRVAANHPHLIGDALDQGAQGVIVPLVESAEQAAAAVRAAHFPPRGARSGGGIRPLRDFPAYVTAAEQTLVSVMIETRAGLDNAAAIAATPGVDMIFIGPGDLGLCIGKDALEAAVAIILDVSRAAGVPCGIFTSGPEAAAQRQREGFAFVIAMDDLTLARTGFARALATAGNLA